MELNRIDKTGAGEKKNERDDKVLRTTTIDVDPLDLVKLQIKAMARTVEKSATERKTDTEHKHNHIHKYKEFEKSFSIKM